MMLCLMIALTTLGQTETPAFDRFFEEFVEKRGQIATLQAEFTQQTIMPDEIIETKGRLLYIQPRRLIFLTEDPKQSILLDAKTGYLYEEDAEQVTIFDLVDAAEMELFFLPFENNPEQLRERYSLTLFEITDEAQGKRGLMLEPLAKPDAEEDAEKTFERIRLYLRDKDFLPFRIEVVNPDETRVVIDVPDYQVNQPLLPEATQLKLLPGTDIFEGDVFLEQAGDEGILLPEPIIVKLPEKGNPVEESAP